jgi:Tol biopolymer transport system component
MTVGSSAPFGAPTVLPMTGLPAQLDDDDALEELDPTVGASIDWSRDGTKIVFDSYFNTYPAASDSAWFVVVYDVSTTRVTVVGGGCSGDGRVGCMGPVHDPSWSPDGSYVVYTSQIDWYDDPNDHPATPNLAYAAVTAAPPTAFPDVAGDGDGGFSPSGRHLVFTHDSGVYTASVNGSHRRMVTSGTSPDWRPARGGRHQNH